MTCVKEFSRKSSGTYFLLAEGTLDPFNPFRVCFTPVRDWYLQIIFTYHFCLVIRWFDPDSARETVYDRFGSIETKEITDSSTLETNSDSDSDQGGGMEWNSLFLAAIDIGGSYSGTSFFARSNYEKVESIEWRNPEGLSMSTKTCILFDNNHDLVEFGSSAYERYFEYDEDKRKDFFYIDGLKKDVYKQKDTQIQVYDVQGKSIAACRVFSTTIRTLSQNCLDFISRRLNTKFSYNDMKWVLTVHVPPYCTEQGRSFIRKCASMAGIEHDRVVVLGESAAASEYYHTVPYSSITKIKEKGNEKRSTYSNYLLIDIGGSTTNITVYRQGRHRVKQVGKSYSIDSGGNSVDDEYLSLLKDIFTEEVLGKTKLEWPIDYIEIFSHFEMSKRQNINCDNMKRQIRIKLPFGLIDTYKDLMNKNIRDAVNQNPYKELVRIQTDKLYVSNELYKQLYKRLCEDIIKEMRKALNENKSTPISTFLLVGGVSNSNIVEHTINQAFPDMQIIRSYEAAEVVRKGALQLALISGPRGKRIAGKTIGIRTQPLFDEKKHTPMKRISVEGVDRCIDVFDVFVRRGHEVRCDHPISREVKTIRQGQQYVDIVLVTSLNEDPEYVDDQGCEVVGKIRIRVGHLPSSSTIKLTLRFGGTEIELFTEDTESKEILKSSMHFLL
ncbi:unnamed protein product [Mytilus coruscus]|uniref:HSPA12A n=1 Tax=Mytilus coruscus TaxID=42192 RepID=A0A6J8AK53_MYTCO|nr:unnamed protein product [Mytilus coruscus]